MSQEYSGFAFVHVKVASRGREGVFHTALDGQPSALRRIPFGFVTSCNKLGMTELPPGTIPVELHPRWWSDKVVHTCGYPC